MMHVYFSIFISFVCLLTLQSSAVNPGVTGRWCAQGRYDMNTGVLGGYDDDHYCGLWDLWCVSISYSDNTTRFDYDNAGGIFPKCDHDREKNPYSYQKEELYIYCCPDDHCNDCSIHPLNCINPLALTTTSTAGTTTITTKNNTTTTPPPIPSTTAISNVQKTTPIPTEKNNFDLTTQSFASTTKNPLSNIIISFCIISFVLNYC